MQRSVRYSHFQAFAPAILENYFRKELKFTEQTERKPHVQN